MLRAHTVADVCAAEKALATELPEGELMRRASGGLAEALGDVPVGEVLLVLVGPGNNGGDALFAAVHLLDRGVRVDLCLLDPGTVHDAGLAAARAAGARLVDAPAGHRHVLDAVLGIGARPGLPDRAVEWAAWIDEHRPHVVAVDVPSGIDVDGAGFDGPHVRATTTVTFGTHKVGSLVDPAAGSGGDGPPRVVDIGLGPYLSTPAVEAIEDADGPGWNTAIGPGRADQKYSRGVIGIAAGSEQYAGAAHLCVAGAQAGAAGMLRFLGSAALSARVVDRAPEVVAGRGRVQAWVVGPGAGDDVADHLAMALDDGVPVVVDAGGLAHLPATLPGPALLTPHAGELAAMLQVEREAVEAAPLRHARVAAERWRATVLLKGSRTLVVAPGERPVRVNLSGTPWLATAGAGDVLAGLAGSLLACGLDPLDAGSLAAFLHGRAAETANPGGPIVASDVARELPRTLAGFLRGPGVGE
ncbi:bifunctional ADP-dependent NAD(P)H-hydrate dehydratase/NAD(P)H-hydrate epimerase [Aeromicrobium sp. CF4.19]|uniref:bifunctional ADP-dependent NAD(P)H-hydrate dehydratase/NAD(P)H-hydrate epimerase n=1 Tax=Aeromicrobium sp. CF4.19 TaxID=3373082 RepID=UPI003EE5CBFC